jgi:hypothetical protein
MRIIASLLAIIVIYCLYTFSLSKWKLHKQYAVIQ